MVNNIVHAAYSETYDLNTAVDELSLLAIHTPQAGALKRMFKGFFENYKKYKILGCNFQLSCASEQALTPELIGRSSGDVDPRDIMNPILFKACTGENLNVLLNQIYDKKSELSAGLFGSVGQHIEDAPDAINTYYQLLGDLSWRKAHPQKGLTVTGLKPMVHKVVTTQPFKWTGYDGTPTNVGGVASRPIITAGATDTSDGTAGYFGGPSGADVLSTASNSTPTNLTNPTVFVSDGVTEMPWLDTTVQLTQNREYVYQGGDDYSANYVVNAIINDVPRVYMGCLVLPPAINQMLFFRMEIVWHIEFKDFRPAFELGNVVRTVSPELEGMKGTSSGSSTYWDLYHTPSAKMSPSDDSRESIETSSFTTTPETQVTEVVAHAQ